MSRATEQSQPCPTCTGPTRETVNLVCQTCGTDYGAPATAAVDALGNALSEAWWNFGAMPLGLAVRDQLAEQLLRSQWYADVVTTAEERGRDQERHRARMRDLRT